MLEFHLSPLFFMALLTVTPLTLNKVVLQTKPHQPHVMMRGVKAELLDNN